MGPRRRLIAGLVLAAVATAGWLAVPRRFVVEGVSMGPALLPGDVVCTSLFPAFDRLRRPRRFDRWVLAATDGLAIKRVVGLPGELVGLVDGDLTIDGDVILKSPRLLAEMGSSVASAAPDDVSGSDEGWTRSWPAEEILDDASFDAATMRELVAVRDVGLAAVVAVRDASAMNPANVRIRVGDMIATRPLTVAGHHAVVAGRLDGRFVVATWQVPTGAAAATARACLPGGQPHAWDFTDPSPESVGGDLAPRLGIGSEDERVVIVDVTRWRDVAYRPGADGRTSWLLGSEELLVLGDHPSASTDSRRWGPVKAPALRHLILRAR